MLTPGRIAIGFSNVSHGLTHLFMLLYPTAVLGLEREFGLPYGELLSLSLGGFVLFGLGALPAGWLADKWSELGMLATLLFGMGGAAVLTGLAPSTLWVSVGLALIGLFASIYHPVGIAMVVRHAHRRGRSLGINGVFGGMGLAGGALVAGTLTELIDWRAAFIVPGLVAIVIGVGFVVGARLSGLRDLRVDTHPQPEVSNRAMVSAFFTLALMTMCAGLIFQAFSVALPKVFAERLGWIAGGPAGVGGAVSVVYLIAACVQVFGGVLADRIALKWVYICAYWLLVPVLALAAGLQGLPLLGAVTLMVLLQNGSAPAETALFARYSPARWRATAFGIKFVIALGVSSLAVPLVASIYDRTGDFYWLFLAMAAFALVASCAALLLPSEHAVVAGRTVAANTVPAPAGLPTQAPAGGSDD